MVWTIQGLENQSLLQRLNSFGFFWKGKKLLSSEGVRLIHLFYQKLRYCMSHIVYINYNTTTLLTFPLTSCCWVIVCLIFFTSTTTQPPSLPFHWQAVVELLYVSYYSHQLQHNHLTYLSIDKLLLCYCMSHVLYITTTTQPPYLPFHWQAVVVLVYVSCSLHQLQHNHLTYLSID